MKKNDMKKIVSIIGSNNTISSTRSIANLLKQNLLARNKFCDFEILDTTQLNITTCKGCNNCFSKGYCPLDVQDDMNKLKKKLEEADIIIFACPVYLLHVSSPMKIVLDRVSYWCHLLKLRGKLLVTIVTTSRSGAKITNEYLKNIGIGLGMLPISEIVFEHSNDLSYLINDINKSAYIINKFLTGEKRIYSNELLEMEFILEKNDKLSQEDSSFEKQYWKDNGLLECESFEEVLLLKEGTKNK